MFRRVVLHPLLFAVYPIFALYAHNVYEASPIDLIGPVVISLAATSALFAAAYRKLADPRKAGLIVSFLTLLFFYGAHLVNPALTELSYISLLVTSTSGLVPAMAIVTVLLLACTLAWLIVRRAIGDGVIFTSFLNLFSACLFVIPLTQIVMARPPIRSGDRGIPWSQTPLATLEPPPSKPDIYYIILDSYARADVMRSLFGIDNQPFLRRLEDKGFYVARNSIANYGQTRLCLSCSLNCRYLDEMVRGLEGDLTVSATWIGENDVVATLRPLGYKFVSFSTGFQETDHPGSDQHFEPSPLLFTGFQRLLITTTPLASLARMLPSLDRYESIRERVLYMFDRLPDVADDPAPTFTFAHFMVPHPPFLFGPNGEDVLPLNTSAYSNEAAQFDGRPRDPEVYRRCYRDQAIYVTKRIEETIDRILKKSKTPPIIILQSDHGSGMNLNVDSMEKTDIPERMTILNAYYFPDRRFDKLYDSISPVNSFRVVMDTFFGSKLGLLPDRSFFSTWPEPFVFHDVTDQVAGKGYGESVQLTTNVDGRGATAERPPSTAASGNKGTQGSPTR